MPICSNKWVLMGCIVFLWVYSSTHWLTVYHKGKGDIVNKLQIGDSYQMNTIDNMQDILDSRDIIERIEELKEEREELRKDETEAAYVEVSEELFALEDLAEEASGTPDWEYGEVLVRDSYFTEYAQQLAEDCGMVADNSQWPNYCIDWERAADELKMDYFSVDFDGVEYWVRN